MIAGQRDSVRFRIEGVGQHQRERVEVAQQAPGFRLVTRMPGEIREEMLVERQIMGADEPGQVTAGDSTVAELVNKGPKIKEG